MSSPRALITGITGQDGSYLSELLASAGVEVHGLVFPGDPLRDSLLSLVPTTILHEGNLASFDDVQRVVDDSAPDYVYHLAAASSVAASWENPVLTTDLNGTGSVRLLDAVRRFGQRTASSPRILLASTAEMFGQPTVSPQNENTTIDPVSPYGAVKAFAHAMAHIYRSRGMHVSTVILYNHESPRRPDTFVTRKITKAVARIANGSTEPLQLGNMASRRDWGFAGDYVRAMRLVLQADDPDDFIIATGTSHSIEEFVAAAFAAAGIEDWRSHVEVDTALLRHNDPASFVGDASKAHRVLGWEPTTTFEDLVTMMVQHDLVADRIGR
ncbi:MAG: GDP-mannose 4,6-dehydratase [Actinomycetes bacterium]